VTLNSIKAELAGPRQERKESNATETTLGSPDSDGKMYAVSGGLIYSPPLAYTYTVKKPGNNASTVPEVPSINGALAMNATPPNPATTPINPNALHQHIHDMSSKRIATLDYMRKA
jgi:hypothetical protein